MMRAVKRGLARIKQPLSACHLYVDEVGFKKGHQHVTVISYRQGQALQLTDDRGVERLASYMRSLRDHQLDDIKMLSLYVNIAKFSVTTIHLYNAVVKIAFITSKWQKCCSPSWIKLARLR